MKKLGNELERNDNYGCKGVAFRWLIIESVYRFI